MELAGRARAFNLTVPVAIVEAKRGYEAWIVASLGPTSGDEIRERLGLSSAVAYDGISSRSDPAHRGLADPQYAIGTGLQGDF